MFAIVRSAAKSCSGVRPVVLLFTLLLVLFGGISLAGPTPAIASSQTAVTVYADDQYGVYVFQVNQGDRIEVTASGSWNFGTVVDNGPDGLAGYYDPNACLPSAPVGALIATFRSVVAAGGVSAAGDSDWDLAVGAHNIITAPITGYLFLRMNDVPGAYENNEGYVTASVKVTDAGASRSVRVVAPNGGENWVIGSQATVQWTVGGAVQWVDICVSRDGGASWKLVLENYPCSPGYTHSYTTDVGTPASNSCLIGVGDSTTWNGHGYDVWDQSDGTFRIASPGPTAINVTSPKASDRFAVWPSGGMNDYGFTGQQFENRRDLFAGQPDPIRAEWSSSGLSGQARVELLAYDTVIATQTVAASAGACTFTGASARYGYEAPAHVRVTLVGSNVTGTSPTFNLVPWGTAVYSWMYSTKSLNVYSNFPRPADGGTYPALGDTGYGWRYQCVELAQRFYATEWNKPRHWGVSIASQMFDYARNSLGLQTVANGGSPGPAPGDLIIYSYTGGSGTTGHVSIVTSVSGSSVTVAEQNWQRSGMANLNYSGGRLSDPRDSSSVIRGWVRHPSASGTTSFSDVAYSPYAVAIDNMASSGIITGFTDGTFRPNDPLNRQQFAKMVVRALGLAVTGSEVCPFSDVVSQTGDDPFYPSKYVAVCASHGITTGVTSTTFAPMANITRQQLITMVVRAAGLANPPSAYNPSFSAGQFTLSDHYQNARKAAYAGLLDGLQGVGSSYNFSASSTRGECAQILNNLRSH